MISKEILKKIRKLEIQTKGLVNNLFGAVVENIKIALLTDQAVAGHNL